jgi:hypothetical protein
MHTLQNANTGEVALSGVGICVWRMTQSRQLNLERTQQNRTNEREHGKHRHHIEIQCCKAHVGAPFLVERGASVAEMRANPKREMYCAAAKSEVSLVDSQNPVTNTMIFRDKRFAVTGHKQTK